MWCDHCREEVVPVANKENSEIQECSQCGKHLSNSNETGSDTAQAEQAGASSIAQTAHALLKRWEANRPTAESVPATGPTKDEPPAPVISKIKETEKKIPATPAAVSAQKTESHNPGLTEAAGSPGETIFNDIPSGLDVSEMLPDLIPPTGSLPADAGSSEKQTAGSTEINKPQTEQKKAMFPTDSIPATKNVSSEINRSKATSSVPEITTRKQTVHAGSTLASQNDAGSLLKRKPEPPSRQKTKSPSPQIQKQTGAVASPDTKSEKPMKFKTKSKASTKTSAPPAETSQGRVRFTPPEINDEKIDDLGIQQAIERHHRKQRNWSVLFGQFMVFGGALAMTCGIAIVIGNRFGSMEVAETTGWLTLAGGHLLFVLGIYTHLSSKMEQIWSDMHSRNDEITRLLSQNMTTGIPRKTPLPVNTSSNASFQRSSLPETIREVT